jgi:cell fate (sporulation/competence/biofilm development) regulator YlbF (YheA/YmcA/DUF963 family)
MPTEMDEPAILQKTLELCQTIVDQPEFVDMRQRIDAFLADEQAQSQYQSVVQKSERLQHKQHSGEPLDHDEISEFEADRDTLLNNPVAKGFLDAQQQMQRVQSSVTKYVTKTFELGRVPEPEDLDSCGHGCSCGH